MITQRTLALVEQLRALTRYRIAHILPLLVNAAQQHALITYGELSANDNLLPNKYGYTLGRLANTLASMQDDGNPIPPLTAICVNRYGQPGNGVINVIGNEPWAQARDRVFAYNNWEQVCNELSAAL